ncbi:RNA polymerase II mediator complex protein MED7 [Plasmodium ovale wallikeri]|uniref:Mediator of RNA polymerase II transcription subunit 7 n=1 Tax=Plasmodium ovale wallikeri TaxID=864142 RepID=A0A1A8YME5_PLAOA|nr:RNA polymerase II mediator complex protein MED7 [Plasmodium ovale wallikeri]
MAEKYVSGYPPPPYYYQEYAEAEAEAVADAVADAGAGAGVNALLEKEDHAKNGDQVDFMERANKAYDMYDIVENVSIKRGEISNNKGKKDDKGKSVFIFGRPPPNVLKNNYNIFGMNYSVEKKIEELEPDELLYDQKKNFKEEFIRLYKMYKDCFFNLFDDIVNGRKNDKTIVKYLIKLHINLFHILANLRYYQSVNNIIHVLKVQLKRRQIAIDKMKISLVNVYEYISFVQTHFSKIKMVKDEKKNTKKKKKKRKKSI